MGITNVLTLLGGLALFLYGMQMMGSGLETAAGNRMKEILERLTSNRFKAVLVGALITAAVQSSSATTVMVVGFVNTGLMTLNQAVWVIMGANIGTTITGQLIALDMGAIAPLIAFGGVAVITFAKHEKVKHISSIFAGLGILFIGMDMMSSAMAPLRESEAFLNLMTHFGNPLVGILVGAIFTAVIQSSSASVGILQTLAGTGVIPLSSAVFVLFGQNIGTCITAVLASIGTKRNAKRTTIIHLMFNVIGSVLFTVICLVTPFDSLIEALTPGDPVQQIANVHTIFNITTTLLLLPFGNYMVKFATKILPDTEQMDEEVFRLKYLVPFENNHPVGHAAVLISQLEQEVERMQQMVRKNVVTGFDMLLEQNADEMQKVDDREEYIDYLNAEISKIIMKMMATEMSARDSRCLTCYYRIISNLERIGDHAMNVAEYAEKVVKREWYFSEEAKKEIVKMRTSCIRIMDGISPFQEPDSMKMLRGTAQLEQEIDDMKDRYIENQIARMQTGICRAETSLMYSELLTDFERIGDHALNIAEQYHDMVS